MTNTERLIECAKRYLNQSEEKNNKFSDETELGRKLHDAGQKDGEAWCVYLQEVIFIDAFPESKAWLEKWFSANAVQTFKNFVKAGCKPGTGFQVGDLVIFQKYVNGKATTSGHAGLIMKINDDGSFLCLEGNTNLAGAREGTTVLIKKRRNIQTDNGLNIKGFLTIYDRTK